MIDEVGKKAKEQWDSIAKPIDSLGLMEDYVVKLCQIIGSTKLFVGQDRRQSYFQKRGLFVFCADHGVVEEGVTQTGQEVTKIVAENFAKGCSTVNILARQANVDVFTIDVGMNCENYSEASMVASSVIDRKVRQGTRNLAREAAMTVAECEQAISVGMDCVRTLKAQGYTILSAGEMGIGNTTPTSALAAVMLDLPAKQVTGKGAGLSAKGLTKKCQVVEAAVRRVQEKGLINPVEILAEIGGYEIAAMVGVYLGAKKERIPVILDGAISVVAALMATRIEPGVEDYLLASHVSDEPVGALALEAMGLPAIIHGRMCLGEGTGAMTLYPILDMAVAVYNEMGSFADYDIEAYERLN